MVVLKDLEEYLVTASLPVFWCPGCGNGIILGAIVRAFKALGLKREKTVVVTGIGCWGKADDYLRTNALHTTHGRALAYATGIKAARPELTVVALMGDGDAATIGGNHLIHAARRNIGVTAIVSNNFNYGMTGGQFSATTPTGSYTSTSPYGNAEGEFDLSQLVATAGANYVARATVYHAALLENLIREALVHPGFSFVEVASSCPVYFGRYNQHPTPVDLMYWWKEKGVSPERYREMTEEERVGAFTIGRLVDRQRPDFSVRYRELQQAAAKAEKRRDDSASGR